MTITEWKGTWCSEKEVNERAMIRAALGGFSSTKGNVDNINSGTRSERFDPPDFCTSNTDPEESRRHNGRRWEWDLLRKQVCDCLNISLVENASGVMVGPWPPLGRDRVTGRLPGIGAVRQIRSDTTSYRTSRLGLSLGAQPWYGGLHQSV
jgi:hypothetical protein